MKTNRILVLITIFVFCTQLDFFPQENPSVCFTFDDGNPKDVLNYNYLEWNQMILDHLKKNNLQAILYVCGEKLDNKKGNDIIESWDAGGHLIANHTYSHLNYNNDEISYEVYRDDILKCDSLINNYKNYTKFFRTPFLKNGNTIEKRDSLISYLKRSNYHNGYVTIDASDWYFNSELIKFMKSNPNQSIDKYRQVYIEHLLDRAKYYDDLAYELLGRRIKHSLILHHNLTSALFLGDLIMAFKDNGWNFINAEDAITDEVYKKDINTMPAGESIIWSIAKETGRYENKLRYPAEDSQYEVEKFKKIGLLYN